MVSGLRCVLLTLVVVAALAPTARADDGDDASHDRRRLVHAGVAVGLGAIYLTAEVGFSQQLSPTTCRWCNPDSFDTSVRDAVRWNHTTNAGTLSTITGYWLAPLSATGLTVLASGDSTWRRRFDDVIPVVQSALVASLLQHVTKLAVARQRPYAHFAAPGTLAPSTEDNVSFFSGHTTLAFSLAVSAGVVTTQRGYSLAPYVWISGLSLATATGYLRMAADKHYMTDVLAGAGVGSLVGYAWPTLVHPHIRADVAVVPTANGVAAVGSF
jgi:membrane-associated phospholipid phosphatase